MRDTLWKTVRLTAAGALGLASMIVTATPAAANPDPICFMPVDYYCSHYEGHTVGTPGYRLCAQRWNEAQFNGYCDEPEL